MGKNREKRDPLHTAGGHGNRCNQIGKQYGGSAKTKLELALPDPPMPPLGLCLKEAKSVSERHIYNTMFSAALFTRSKIQKSYGNNLHDH